MVPVKDALDNRLENTLECLVGKSIPEWHVHRISATLVASAVVDVAGPGEVLAELVKRAREYAVGCVECLLDAIADGTFGLMKRPADAGRGLDGVAKKSANYFNPASEILEER